MKNLTDPLQNPIAYLDVLSESHKGYRSVMQSHLKCRHHFDFYIPEQLAIDFTDYDRKVDEHYKRGTPWNLAAAEIASWLAENGVKVKL